MGMRVSRGRSAADQVDPLTGLASLHQLRVALREALTEARQLPLAVVVIELPSPTHPVEHARRLTLAAAMAHTAFRSALVVGRLGVRRVGVLSGHDRALQTRADLLGRMVRDVPGAVRVEPVLGSPEIADWMLRELCL